MESADECRLIPLDEIVPPFVLLRPVNVNSVEYLQIRDTCRVRLLNSICVRPSTRWPDKYEVVDGMYRFTAFKELGKSHIPAIVSEMSDEDVLASQIQANGIRRDTTPVEFARQMRRIQKYHLETHGTDIPMSLMAVMTGKEVQWVAKTLSLLNLNKENQKRVERDELPLCNAYMLAKIPPRMQANYVEYAMHMPVAEFEALATSVIRAVMEAARNGKLEAAFVAEHKPVAFLRSLKRVLEEIETHKAGAEFIVRTDCKSPMEAWDAALKWAAQIDDASIEKQRKAAFKRHQSNQIERDSYQKLIESDSPDPD